MAEFLETAASYSRMVGPVLLGVGFLMMAVGLERIGPISERGQIFNGSCLPFLEWKIDATGMPFETFAISEMIEWLRYKKRVS